RIKPADFMPRLRPLMPSQYAPLQASGRGNQGVYLTSLPNDFALELIALIGSEAQNIVHANRIEEADDPSMADVPTDVLEWEEHLVEVIKSDRALSDSEREAVVLARRGQGLF